LRTPFSNKSPISIKFDEILKQYTSDKKNIVDKLNEFDKLKSILLELNEIEDFLIFGSLTNGSSNNKSDLDVIINCPSLLEIIKKYSPAFLMNKIATHLKHSLPENYEIKIDYPTILVLNTKNAIKIEFSPGQPLKTMGIIKFEKDYILLKNKFETMETEVLCTNEPEEYSSKEFPTIILDGDKNQLTSIYKFWKNSYDKGVINIPSFFFDSPYISLNPEKGSYSNSIQDKFNRSLGMLEIHIRMSFGEDSHFAKLNIFSIPKLTNECIDVIKNCNVLSKKAIEFEKDKKFSQALNYWDEIFNNKLKTLHNKI